MSENPGAPHDEDVPAGEGAPDARRSRETGGDAPAAASIEEREALAAEDDDGDARHERERTE